MINGRRVIALVLARGGSKRLPGKNLKDLGGKPLIAWTIQCAQAVKQIDCTLVSTDSPEIATVAKSYGADVPWLRPPELASDTASSQDAVAHALEQCSNRGSIFEFVVLLQPTSPFRRPATIASALELSANWDGSPVISVGPAIPNPALCVRVDSDGFARPYLDVRLPTGRSQEFPPAYVVNGSVYVMGVSRFQAERSFLGNDTRVVITNDRAQSLDIDDPYDWMQAESIASGLGQND